MKRILKTAFLALSLLTTPVLAQSTADNVVLGTLTTSGCAPSTYTPCWVPISATNALPVTGGSGGSVVVVGSTSNASSGVATSSTNLSDVSYMYGFNGTTWDQLQVDGSKNLKVLINGAIVAGSNIIGKVGVDQTTPGTTNAVSLAQLGANTVATGNGTSSTGTLRVAIASDNTANSNPFLMQEVGGTANGLSNFILEPAASDNHTVIKNGAATVYSMTVFSKTATVNYFRLYNAGTGFNGCNSATNILYEGITVSNAAGGITPVNIPPQGIAFSTGVSLCFTGAFGQTDTTNATAASFVVNVQYK